MNRTPPKNVLEALRKEVNFGCPVTDCGSPYLTGHHFNPTWAEKQHHNPEGMIALCLRCAGLADGGRWTIDQLNEMKRNPFVQLKQISEYYGYLREDVVCLIGNVAYDVKSALEINGERVIWFNIDQDGYKRLNILIRDINGQPILVMEDNFWTAITEDLFDLHCSSRGKTLEIVSKDRKTDLSLKFNDYSLDEFRNRLLKLNQEIHLPDWIGEDKRERMRETSLEFFRSNIEELVSIMGSPNSVSTWTIKGKLQWGGVYLEIADSEIVDLAHGNHFGMNFVIGGRTAFSFYAKSAAIGRR